MMQSSRKKIGIFFLLFASIYLMIGIKPVNAISVYDDYECKNNSIYKKGDYSQSVGSCTSSADGSWEECPTASIRNQYKLDVVQASVSYAYNKDSNTYTAYIKNATGLQFLVKYDSLISNTIVGTFTPNGNGIVTIPNLQIGRKIVFLTQIGTGAATCGGSQLGVVYSNVPSEAVNVLYSDAMCVNFRASYGSNAYAEKMVPECFNKTAIKQYDYNTVKEAIKEATKLLQLMNEENAASGGNLNLSCDFYANKNTGSKGSYTKTVSSSSDYWDIVCTETLEVVYDTPRAVLAGEGFDYKSSVRLVKKCRPVLVGNPSDPGGGGSSSTPPTGGGNCTGDFCHPPGSATCKYTIRCSSETAGGAIYVPHSGPNETFDNCVKACDNGKYSQDCVNSCYSEVYKNSSKGSGKGLSAYFTSYPKVFKVGHTELDAEEVKKILNDWGIDNAMLTGYTSTGYTNNPNCKITHKWDKPHCTTKIVNGDCVGGAWITQMAECDTPGGVTYEVSSGCNGNSTCYEVCTNCAKGCKDVNNDYAGNSTPDDSGGGGNDDEGYCEGEGQRVIDFLEEEYERVFDELDSGEYNYDGDSPKFTGKIIDSYTNEEVLFNTAIGSGLVTATHTTSEVTRSHYGTKKFTYHWECEVEVACPEPDDDDEGSSSGGPGDSGGGSGYPGGGACGPGCVSSENGSISATPMANDGDTCYDTESHSESTTFDIYEYKTVETYEISLPKAYISAVDGNTVYGETLFGKLNASIKNEYYEAGNKYYTSPYSPLTNDYRKWPTYPGNNGVGISKNDPSIKKNIFQYFTVGSWSQWKVNIECFYGVINKYCVDCSEGDEEKPSYCNPETDICESGLQYIFRTIDLGNKNMFPNSRSPRWNWTDSAKMNSYLYPVNPTGVIDHIQTSGFIIYQNSDADTGQSNNPELDYEIKLTKSNIRNIRSYNKTRDNYSDYDMYCKKDNGKTVCESRFLGEAAGSNTNQYMSVIRRGKPGCNNEYNGECVNY